MMTVITNEKKKGNGKQRKKVWMVRQYVVNDEYIYIYIHIIYVYVYVSIYIYCIGYKKRNEKKGKIFPLEWISFPNGSIELKSYLLRNGLGKAT